MNIFAYTAQGLAPEYISVNGTPSGIQIVFRSPGHEDGTTGVTTSMFFTDEQAAKLADGIKHYLATK